MAWGLRIKGEAGQLQIDGTFQNYQLAASGTLYLGDTVVSGNALTLWKGELTLTSLVRPIVAFMISDDGLFFTAADNGGGSFTWTIYKNAGDPGKPARTITYYVFDVLAAVSSGNWGMRIRNASNVPVFDFIRKPMRVVDFVKEFNIEGVPLQKTYVSGRSYVATVCRFSGYSDTIFLGVGPGTDRLDRSWTATWKPISSGVEFGQVPTALYQHDGSNPPVYEPYESTAADYLVLDVTDY